MERVRNDFLVFLIALWIALGIGEIYPSIHWTPYNPIFSENKNELRALPNNKITIVCPNPSTALTTMKDRTFKERLYENLWAVDKTGYDTCSVNGKSRLILTCDSPLTLKYASMVFRRYQADPNELEFIPGDDYFFIATSKGTKESLNSTSGGHCSSHNMKYKLYVCKDIHDKKCRNDATSEENRKLPQEKSTKGGNTEKQHNGTDTRESLKNNTHIEENCRMEHCETKNIPTVALSMLLIVAIVSVILNAVLIWRHLKGIRNQKQSFDLNVNRETSLGVP